MQEEIEIRCPACRKVNRILRLEHPSGEHLCSRCEADLSPLVNIQLWTHRLEAQALRSIQKGDLKSARNSLKQAARLSKHVTPNIRLLNRLFTDLKA
jgi:hypothetical protein